MDHCRRVGQPESPFEIKFNEQEELDESCNYIQVDGEFFKCSKLVSIQFRLADDLENGSICVRQR